MATKISETTHNFINGKFVSNDAPHLDVISPIDGKLISTVPLSSMTELDEAVQAARNAFPEWSGRTLKERVQVFYKYRELLEKHMDELTEFACSMPQIITNEVQEVSRGVEVRIDRKPLGVVASIAPFNFPNMVPHWTVPNAIVLGNCMILKPSEVVPVSSVKIAELLKEAGLPDGVFNIVNGGKEIVEAICDHPDIKAVSLQTRHI